MDFIVGLWTRDVTSETHSARGLNGQLSSIGYAVEALSDRVAHYGIPGGQAIQGILICPEYFMSASQHGEFHTGIGRFRQRSVSHHDKAIAINRLKAISQNYPTILMVPGTIAWTKPFERGGGAPSRVAKAQAHIQAAQTLGIGNLSRREEVSGSALLAMATAFRQYSRAVATHRAAIDAALPFGVWNTWTVDRIKTAVEGLVSNDVILQAYMTHKGIGLSLVEFRQNLRRVRPSLNDKANFITNQVVGHEATMKLLRNTAIVLLNGNVQHKYHKHGDFFEAIGENDDAVFVPGNRDSSVIISGIRFGFEICLDHNLGTLSARVPPQQKPDIHIVCSDTVTNDTTKIYSRPGGFFLHASSVAKNTAIYKVLRDGTKEKLDNLSLEFLEDYNIPGLPNNADNRLSIWQIDLTGRPRLDNLGRTLAKALIDAVVTWENGATGFFRSPSQNSQRACTWIKANAHARTEAELNIMAQWLVRTPTVAKPAFMPANIDQLSNNGHLFNAVRDARTAWNRVAI